MAFPLSSPAALLALVSLLLGWLRLATVVVAGPAHRSRIDIVFGTGVTSGDSSATTFGIPNDQSLVGAYIVFQPLAVDPTLTSLSWGNATDLFVNN